MNEILILRQYVTVSSLYIGVNEYSVCFVSRPKSHLTTFLEPFELSGNGRIDGVDPLIRCRISANDCKFGIEKLNEKKPTLPFIERNIWAVEDATEPLGSSLKSFHHGTSRCSNPLM